VEGLLRATDFADAVADLPGYAAFTLLDIGCSGGIDAGWRRFGDRLRAVGFDPNLSECERLRAQETLPGVTYVPAFVGLPANHPFLRRRAGERTAARDVWERLSATRSMAIRQGREQAMDAEELRKLNLWDRTALADPSRPVFLPDFVQSAGIADIDFIKIDVDGEDFAVLNSLSDCLNDLQVLGVGLEVSFDGSDAETENSFHNMDRFMRARGFDLFGLTVNRYSHAALPGIYRVAKPAETLKGRPMLGDAIYLRDICAIRHESLAARLPPDKLLKLAAIASLADVPDLAAEILVRFRARLDGLIDVARALDLLAAQAQADLASPLTYPDYLAAFEADDARFYTRAIQGEYLDRLRPGPAGHKAGRAIVANVGSAGNVSHGPYLWMPTGIYTVSFIIIVSAVDAPSSAMAEAASAGTVDVFTPAGERVLARREFGPHDREITLSFHVDPGSTDSGIEFRVWSSGLFSFAVKSVALTSGAGRPFDAQPMGTTSPSAAGRIKALEAEIAALRQSTSWRLTGPLRGFSSALRGARPRR
jgi:hypothetical protein